MSLENLSVEQLKEELKRREQNKKEVRETYKGLIQETVPEIISDLMTLSAQLSIVKTNTFKKLKTLIDLKKEVYELKENQQSHTFTHEEGASITYGFRVLDSWDDSVSAGVEKIKEFLKTLAVDDNSSKLVDTINQLLKKDAKGNLKANRVIELSNLAEKFNNEEFSDGVEIIRKSYQPVRSVFFIDAYYLDGMGKKVNIPLSISAVDFPIGTKIEELFPC